MQVVGTLYTHHQKCVIVDSQGPGNKRKVTSFIGGLDLCDGRFDTPSHPLFSTLNTFHKNDFHNPTFTVSSPWEYLTVYHGKSTRFQKTSFLILWKIGVKLFILNTNPFDFTGKLRLRMSSNANMCSTTLNVKQWGFQGCQVFAS